MRFLAVGLLALSFAGGAEFDHSRWDRILKQFVNEKGEIDYAGLRKDHREMDAYLAELKAASPVNQPQLFPGRADAMAYWINAYNAFVTSGVAAKYPTASVRDLGFAGGFFRARDYVAGGVTMSLNNVEHDTLRKVFQEPRVHFAIVCASLGCPFLAREAFTGKLLEQQLERGARRFVNEERNVSLNLSRNEITLSKIFDWYEGDFGGRAGVLQFLMKYSAEDQRKKLAEMKDPKVRFRDYDWHVNDPGSRAREGRH